MESKKNVETEGLSAICAGLGTAQEDEDGNRIGYRKNEYCLDNLKDLLRFLRRDDPLTRDVFKQVCKWNIISEDLIPIIEHCQEDRNLVLNAVKVLVFLTMPIDPASADTAQQLEYLWELKSSITNSDVIAVIVSFLESPLENLERDAFTEDDWKLVQLVLTLFRNILAVQEVSLQQTSKGSASQFLSLRDRFLELLFRENVMDIILVITLHVGGSGAYLRHDNLLLLEIFHYIFMGQDPELIIRTHLNGQKVVEGTEASLNRLKSIMDEEKEKRRLSRLNNMSRHSQFSGMFARVTLDGSKAVIKGNPKPATQDILHKSQNVTRGPAKKIAWDHPRLPSTSDILQLLHGFLNQFLSGGYNVLMQSIREDIEKEHPAIQRNDVVVFFQAAEFVTSFQFYKHSASKNKEGVDKFETFGDNDGDSTDFCGHICGPIAASMNESMFQLVISKWRDAFDGLKETNDHKFLSAAGSLLKNMIRMLDLVLKLLPEDSKEPQTARILLYKLFYDQTEQGMTQFLLNSMKMFDSHKQPKSDLADMLEIIHKTVKLMENLQARGTLRVSRKSRKMKKKKSPEGKESKDNPSKDHSCIPNEADNSIDNQLTEIPLPQKECPLNPSSDGEEDIIPPNNDEMEKHVEEEENSQGGLAQMKTKNSGHPDDNMSYGADDSSGDEQLTTINEVDFKVSTLVSAFANHNIIQRLCWLLKFYKSNSLATNHYIICMLQRITDDLQLHPMLYQLSLLTTFYDILVEQKSCPCPEYANIVDFLNNLVRKMLRKMKRQPLLFVEILFWKTRGQCHYINVEYLLDDLGHLQKETRNWNTGQGDQGMGSSPVKFWARRSLADALGDDEADVVITHDSGYQMNGEQLDDAVGPFASTSNSKERKHDNNNREQLIDEIGMPSRRNKRFVLDGELEEQIKDLYEKFKDDRHCSRRIAEVLDPNGQISPAQISNQLKKLGLRLVPKRKVGDVDNPLSTSPNQLENEGTAGVANFDNSATLEGSLSSQQLNKRKRVHAFSEDQEALIRNLYEQFKDQRRCNHMIANALDVDGKFTPAQVSRKLKQLGLSLPRKKGFGGNVHPKDKGPDDYSRDRADESDDETLISLMKRKKMKNIRMLGEELQQQSDDEGLLIDESDDEMLSSVLKKSRSLKSKNEQLEAYQTRGTTMESDILNRSKDAVLTSDDHEDFENTPQMEYHQVEGELEESDDEMGTTVLPAISVSRRKLRMVIDPEDDDD